MELVRLGLVNSAKKVVDGLNAFRTYIRNTASSSRTSASVDSKGKRLARHSWSRRSTRVSRRFVKKQQMQWTLRGADLLLQTRTRVLNEDLDDLFRRWYPKFRSQPQTQEPERKAA